MRESLWCDGVVKDWKVEIAWILYAIVALNLTVVVILILLRGSEAIYLWNVWLWYPIYLNVVNNSLHRIEHRDIITHLFE